MRAKNIVIQVFFSRDDDLQKFCGGGLVIGQRLLRPSLVAAAFNTASNPAVVILILIIAFMVLLISLGLR